MSKEIKAIINDLEEERERIRTKCLYPEDVLNCEDLIKIMDYIKQLEQRIDKAIECISNFLCTEEYINVDGKAIANNYEKILEILNGGENNR